MFSGIGNAYSDEILHRARLSPMKQTRHLDEAEIEALHATVREVLQDWCRRLREETGDDFPEKVTAFRPGMAVHRVRLPCSPNPLRGQRMQLLRPVPDRRTAPGRPVAFTSSEGRLAADAGGAQDRTKRLVRWPGLEPRIWDSPGPRSVCSKSVCQPKAKMSPFAEMSACRIAFAHSESRRYAPPSLRFGPTGDSLLASAGRHLWPEGAFRPVSYWPLSPWTTPAMRFPQGDILALGKRGHFSFALTLFQKCLDTTRIL